MLGLKNDSWDVQMLGILQCFIDPSFENLGTHLQLLVGAPETIALIRRLYGGFRVSLSQVWLRLHRAPSLNRL